MILIYGLLKKIISPKKLVFIGIGVGYVSAFKMSKSR